MMVAPMIYHGVRAAAADAALDVMHGGPQWRERSTADDRRQLMLQAMDAADRVRHPGSRRGQEGTAPLPADPLAGIAAALHAQITGAPPSGDAVTSARDRLGRALQCATVPEGHSVFGAKLAAETVGAIEALVNAKAAINRVDALRAAGRERAAHALATGDYSAVRYGDFKATIRPGEGLGEQGELPGDPALKGLPGGLHATIERLCMIADRAAAQGYTAAQEPAPGAPAGEARVDLDALQHAIVVLRGELRARMDERNARL